MNDEGKCARLDYCATDSEVSDNLEKIMTLCVWVTKFNAELWWIKPSFGLLLTKILFFKLNTKIKQPIINSLKN